MKKFEGIEQIGFTVNKAHNVAFGTVGEYKFIINFLPQQRQYSPFSYRPLSAPE